jgi:hypothetical protein
LGGIEKKQSQRSLRRQAAGAPENAV